MTRRMSSVTSRSGMATRSSAGSRRAAMGTMSGSRSPWAIVPTALATPDGPGGAGFEIETSVGDAPRGSSRSPSSTRRVFGCASDRGSDRHRRPADRVRGRRLDRGRDRARWRGAGTRRHAVSRGETAATAWGWSTGSRTCARARSRRDRGSSSSGTRSTGTRHSPSTRHGVTSRSCARRPGSSSSEAVPPDGASPPITQTPLCSTPRTGRRSSASMPGRPSSPGRRPGCCTSRPRRWWSPLVLPNSAGLPGQRSRRAPHPASGGERLRGVGVALPTPVVTVGRELVRFEGDAAGRVTTVVTTAGSTPARTVIVDLGRSPRDLLARMAGPGAPVTAVGSAADAHPLPPPPTDPSAVVCRCMSVTVGDLGEAWSAGYSELELLKRATYAGIGTCQGGACLPTCVPDSRRARGPNRSRSPLDPVPARSPSTRRPPTRRSMSSGGRRCTTSTWRSGRGWTDSVAGGGRGTTATRSRNTGRSASGSPSVT